METIKALLDFLAESTLRTGLPIPLPREEVYSWAGPLKLPRRGERLLYTGALYQLTPYFERITGYLEALNGLRGLEFIIRISKVFVSMPRLVKTILSPPSREVARARAILTKISKILTASGLAHAYPYEDDIYSGVLLYDMGYDEAFSEVAVRVYRVLKERGAREIITVDPHTTHVLRRVYPNYVDGFDLEVKNYLEILAEAVEEGRVRLKRLIEEAVLHDPCFYARYEGIIEEPRRILEAAGIEVKEPRRTREMTYCCGGPIESIAPRLSSKIAETRLEELAEKSRVVIVMCPICYANLSRANKLGLKIIDIAEAIDVEV
jgi:Fe-S oxidoreductase